MTLAQQRSEISRFLRQRRDLGAGDWIFEERSRAQVLEALRGLRGKRLPGDTRPGRPAPTTHSYGMPSAGSASVETTEGYEELRSRALRCTRCRLADGRSQVVFSDGNPNGRVVVVGEAPGAHEDRTGLPFVGAAGKLLDLLLATIDLSREKSVYICNVIKCRPPGNRNPLPDEIAACSPFLRQQTALVQPEAILATGAFAAQLLSGTDRPLGKLRGEVYAYEGIPVVVTYHPAALLRNPGWTRSTWEDLQLLRHVLDGR